MTMRWTIRAKLTALVLAVLLPLMAAAGVKFWLEVEQGRERAQSDMIECAGAVAQLFDEILTGQIENLEALAGARAPDRIRSEDLVDAATRIKRHHGFVHRLVAVLPDGTIAAASGPTSCSRRGRSVITPAKTLLRMASMSTCFSIASVTLVAITSCTSGEATSGSTVAT